MLFRAAPLCFGGLCLVAAGSSAAEPLRAPANAPPPTPTLVEAAQPPSPSLPLSAPPVTPKAFAPLAGQVIPSAATPSASGPITTPRSPAPVPEPVRLSDDPRPTLGPQTFVATVNAAERYRTMAEAGGWPIVPNGATRLKPGERSPAVPAIRQRLAATGDLEETARLGDALDDALAAGLRRFQLRHGLEETGLVGPRTLHHLNVPASTRLRQLQASANRLMGSSFPFGERYVAVNIPSAAVEAVSGGSVIRRHVAIVGKTDRPSPTVETKITSVNLNPTWTAPVSVIKKDIIPHMRKDAGYLAKMKIRILDGTGAEIDPARIDWSTERAANYTLRQDSGVENSLGEIRLDMPNRHAVYMHDTPSKGLFARTRRLQSSGCVRVAGVKDLALWLLEGANGPGGPGTVWSRPELDGAIAAGKRVDIRLTRGVPVAWVYLTGYATADGTVHFRDDVYGLDEPAAAPAQAADLTIDKLVTSAIGTSR